MRPKNRVGNIGGIAVKVRVCPNHILKMFKLGKASDQEKEEAVAQASAWFKSQLADVHPRDVIYMPNPDTGRLEAWVRNDRGAVH